MLALCLMLSGAYYAKNYASIIGLGLLTIKVYAFVTLYLSSTPSYVSVKRTEFTFSKITIRA